MEPKTRLQRQRNLDAIIVKEAKIENASTRTAPTITALSRVFESFLHAMQSLIG